MKMEKQEPKIGPSERGLPWVEAAKVTEAFPASDLDRAEARIEELEGAIRNEIEEDGAGRAWFWDSPGPTVGRLLAVLQHEQEEGNG